MHFPAEDASLLCCCQKSHPFKKLKKKQKTGTPVLPGKDFGLLEIDSFQRWELRWLAAGWAMGVIIQDRLNKAPTYRQKYSRLTDRQCLTVTDVIYN